MSRRQFPELTLHAAKDSAADLADPHHPVHQERGMLS